MVVQLRLITTEEAIDCNTNGICVLNLNHACTAISGHREVVYKLNAFPYKSCVNAYQRIRFKRIKTNCNYTVITRSNLILIWLLCTILETFCTVFSKRSDPCVIALPFTEDDKTIKIRHVRITATIATRSTHTKRFYYRKHRTTLCVVVVRVFIWRICASSENT